jgi:hypothetical protein
MGVCMDIFMDQKIKEQALGQIYDAEKKEKQQLKGQRIKGPGFLKASWSSWTAAR